MDLSIKTPACAMEDYLSDTLCIKLLDKDGLLPEIPESNDSRYHVRKPSKAQYESCCNEFFGCLNNVAKGIVRDQMPYAWRMYHQVVHVELEKMAEWYIAAEHDYSDLRRAIFAGCDLFRSLAVKVGTHLGYVYNENDEKGMMRYVFPGNVYLSVNE